MVGEDDAGVVGATASSASLRQMLSTPEHERRRRGTAWKRAGLSNDVDSRSSVPHWSSVRKRRPCDMSGRRSPPNDRCPTPPDAVPPPPIEPPDLHTQELDGGQELRRLLLACSHVFDERRADAFRCVALERPFFLLRQFVSSCVGHLLLRSSLVGLGPRLRLSSSMKCWMRWTRLVSTGALSHCSRSRTPRMAMSSSSRRFWRGVSARSIFRRRKSSRETSPRANRRKASLGRPRSRGPRPYDAACQRARRPSASRSVARSNTSKSGSRTSVGFGMRNRGQLQRQATPYRARRLVVGGPHSSFRGSGRSVA